MTYTLRELFTSLCRRPNRPQYGSCPSVSLSVRLSVVPCGFLKREQKGVAVEPKLALGVFLGRSSGRGNVQVKRSKMKVAADVRNLQETTHISRKHGLTCFIDAGESKSGLSIEIERK